MPPNRAKLVVGGFMASDTQMVVPQTNKTAKEDRISAELREDSIGGRLFLFFVEEADDVELLAIDIGCMIATAALLDGRTTVSLASM